MAFVSAKSETADQDTNAPACVVSFFLPQHSPIFSRGGALWIQA
jgi:hypothetical protein